MRGLSLAENDTGDQVLGPISRVSMADSIDYDAGKKKFCEIFLNIFLKQIRFNLAYSASFSF